MTELTLQQRVRADLVALVEGDFSCSNDRRKLRVWDKTGGHCFHCKNPLGFDWEIDHLVPRAHGGSNRQHNLVPSCIPCNRAKGDSLDWKP